MLLLILSVSCVLEEPDVMESNLHNPEIYKAKNWFEAQDFNAQSHKNQNSSSSRKDMPYLEKRPDWNLTKQHTNAAGQEVLEISLKFERSMISKYMLEKFKNKKPRPDQISQNMLMVAKENGEYDIFILKIHSKTDLSVNNRKDFFQKMNYGTVSKDFSGEMIISTIDQVPIKGWKVQEGKKLSRFKIIHDSGTKNLSTANFSSTCGFSEEDHCVVTSGWFYDEEFGWDYGSEISCTTFTHLECIDEDNDSQNPAKDDDDPLGNSGDITWEAEKDDCNTFDERVKHVLNSEGGFTNDSIDRGGPTNRGISWDVWVENAQEILGREPNITNLQSISAEEAILIYKAKFWDKIYLDQINDGDLRWLIFDFHVNSGGNAIKVLQKELNKMGHILAIDGGMGEKTISAINSTSDIVRLYNNYKIGRKTYCENIVQDSVKNYKKKYPNAQYDELIAKTQLKYNNGWMNRINNFINKTIDNFKNVNC